ncbi:DUF5610 domain-containing protein [Rheinheimera baltica]|uniref:DUF5610 domain-containing protein n=1 Tax=Rheinheimera baltica TaxID=67576 RepID=A0ABT9HZS5_9GAMM|nr:DUF5610 domain-containing protein [Rheinheimera baltica]MDP5136618.1 DUF5610 domain-containing protein [Rheinheimera baltica]MDP5144073.1 DUF5610 domain-containing protein [Rheinheimera baltica]MDP5148883.1 DUF5610 domain-containing protein [Rheinheimera baltica]MDP5189915.1 DUF5610 domain-containing protein [Rheinheimera baltica]
MSITSSNNASVVGINKRNANAVKTDQVPVESDKAQAKKAQNVAILRANEEVSLRSNNDSLSLLFKTALEGINAELEPVLGENAAQKVYDSGIDTSPEATADRITAYATAFYSRYKELDPDTAEEQRLDNFMSLISEGIEKGFADAKDILTSLKVFEGDIESDVDKTYGLVMQGLQNFREKMLELAANPPAQDDNGSDKPVENELTDKTNNVINNPKA